MSEQIEYEEPILENCALCGVSEEFHTDKDYEQYAQFADIDEGAIGGKFLCVDCYKQLYMNEDDGEEDE